MSLLASPGKYTVSLKVGDEVQSHSFTLLKDPNTEGSLSDIEAQKELLDKIHLDYEAISKTVNEAEKIRRQLRDMLPMLSGDRAEQVKKLDSVATALENQMIQLKHSGKGQDQIRLPGMLMEKLSYLASTVAIADFKPADQYVEVYQELHTEWIAVEQAWNQFKKEEVAAFQNTMKSASAGPLIIGAD
jgi:DNA primase catalytic subunit